MDFEKNLPFDMDEDNEEHEEELAPGMFMSAKAFSLGPDGKFHSFNVNNDDLKNILGGKTPTSLMQDLADLQRQNISIFNGEYTITEVSVIEDNHDCVRSIYLECYQTPMMVALPGKKHTIYDVYEYLENSQYLNFLMAYKYDISLWDKRAIKLNVQVDTTGNRPSKILILVEAQDIPQYTSEISTIDFICETTTQMVTAGNLSIMESITRKRAYYEPFIFYDVHLAIPEEQPVTFDNISVYHLYEQFIKKYVNEMIRTFYPESLIKSSPALETESSIHAYFTVDFSNRLFNVCLCGSPAWILRRGGYYPYHYNGKDSHIIGKEPCYPIDEIDIESSSTIEFLNRISSSREVQMFAVSSHADCSTYQYGEEVKLAFTYPKAFVHDRIIYDMGRLKYAGNICAKPGVDYRSIIPVYQMESSYSNIHSYWVPLPLENNGVIIDPEPYQEESNPVWVFGFINYFYTNIPNGKLTYGDIIRNYQDEIVDALDLPEEIVTTNFDNMLISEVYRDDMVLRIVIGKVLPPRKHQKLQQTNNQPKEEPSHNKPAKKRWFF